MRVHCQGSSPYLVECCVQAAREDVCVLRALRTRRADLIGDTKTVPLTALEQVGSCKSQREKETCGIKKVSKTDRYFLSGIVIITVLACGWFFFQVSQKQVGPELRPM